MVRVEFVELCVAEVARIDHRASERFECVMQRTDAIESLQQAPELVFPGERPLDGVEALFKNGGIEKRLAAAPVFFPAARIGIDIGRHAEIEDSLAIGPAIEMVSKQPCACQYRNIR